MTDDANTKQLTERQEKILSLIIRMYVTRPDPVGSKAIVDTGFSMSSATIRNEMAVLEEMGYIVSPHTSAGRIPTEVGYRYFVRRLLDESELTLDERRDLTTQFASGALDMDGGLRLSATMLARTAHGAALVTKPQAANSQFKHVELISTQGRLVLMVLVLYGGNVRQQMLTLADTLAQETLSAAAARLNAICDKLTAEQIRQKARTADLPLEREILDLIAETQRDADAQGLVVAYREGLTDILAEFTESNATQQAVRLMEEQTLLGAIMSDMAGEQVDGVNVVIAGEGRWEQVRHLSLVLTRYGTEGQVSGMMGVFGPTRMRYGRAIASVRYVAGLMSGLLISMYGDERHDPPPPWSGVTPP